MLNLIQHFYAKLFILVTMSYAEFFKVRLNGLDLFILLMHIATYIQASSYMYNFCGLC